MRGTFVCSLIAMSVATAAANDNDENHVDRLTLSGNVGVATALNEYDDLEQTMGPIVGARVGYRFPIGGGWLEPGFAVHHVRPTYDRYHESILHNTSALLDVQLGAPWGRARLFGRLGFGATFFYHYTETNTKSSFRFGTVMAALGVDVLAFGNTSIGAEAFYESFRRENEYDGLGEQVGVSLAIRWAR